MTSKSKTPSANAGMHVSEQGLAALAKSEGFSPVPYNDVAKNCTVGTGILLHKGPCSPKELSTKFSLSGLSKTFLGREHEAEGYVIFYVRRTKLNQAQFDALTSFVYNVGVGNAKQALAYADAGQFKDVADEMKMYVNARALGKNGKPYLKKFAGLVTRRELESAPFMSNP